MPCKHHFGEIAKWFEHGEEQEAPAAAATIIYCFAWRGGPGFQRFTLQEVYWTLDENKKEIMKLGEKFTVEYVDPEELQGRFLYFLSQHTNDLWKWNVWVEAFVSLFFGGLGAQFAPGWRYRQLQKRHDETHPSVSTATS